MTTSSSGKSLWEYILLTVSGFATLVQVLGLISQSQALFAQPSITVTFVVIILIATAVGGVFVLFRRKPGKFTAQVPYYTGRQRTVAGGLLGTNLIVSIFVLASIIWRPCLTSEEPISSEKFGILVADFTEGLNRSPTLRGVELAQRTRNALNGRLATSSLTDKVEVRGICAIRNADEAHKAGQYANASLVLWGNVAEFAQDTFEPSFTFVDPLLWPSEVDPLIFEVELNRVDSIELPSKISARATSIAAFVIGLIYLKEAENAWDYSLALHEFSSAIANTEPELANLAKGSEQELSVKRTLAIFYVLRGRASAGLSDNQSALEDYSAAETYDPNYPSIYVARGNYYYGLRDFNQAESQYRKAILLRDSASAYYGLGNALFYLNHYQESIAAYLKAISLIEAKGEDPSGVRIVLGVVYNLNGETQLALEQLNMVVQSMKSSQLQKEQAKNIIASILNPTPTLVIASNTPTATATYITTAIQSGTPVPTLIIVGPSQTRKPKERATKTLLPTPFPPPTSIGPTDTPFPPPEPPTSPPPTPLPPPTSTP